MTSRREFLGAAAVTATSRVLGANDRINIGIIGVGGMGFGHVKMLKPRTDIRITAISDIYTTRKQRARDFLGLADKDVHHEYKDLLARSDVDAVFVVTPDHWHYRMAMDALDAGKDVYVQKPMAYRIEEAKAMAERVKKTGRVLQVGSQYASEPQYFRAREASQQGLIGKPLWAQGTYCRNTFHGEWNYQIDAEGTEDNIDWKRFLGSAPEAPLQPGPLLPLAQILGLLRRHRHRPALSSPGAVPGDAGAAVPGARLLERRHLRPQGSRSARHDFHHHRVSGFSGRDVLFHGRRPARRASLAGHLRP